MGRSRASQISQNGRQSGWAKSGMPERLTRDGRTDPAVHARSGAWYRKRLAPHFAQVGEHMLPLIQQILDRAHAEGTLREDVGIHDFPIIMAMVTELAQNSSACRPQLYERYLTLIVDGLRTRPDNSDLGTPLTDDDVQAVMRECVPPLKTR